MVNKKDCFICNLTLFFLCFIISSIIVYSFSAFVFDIFDEPEFKITKEVCENKTYYDIDFEGQTEVENLEYFYFNVGCSYIDKYNISSIMCDEYKKIIKDAKDSIKPSEEIITEICEEIEVNEINYTIDALEGSPSVIELWEYYCIDNYEINKEECDTLPRYFDVPILKEDLTIDWLEKNCEIWDWECPNSNSNMCSGYDKDTIILEYKCGDYKIEVIQ